ncbi:TetR/AcrR family transcriptional regulator [Nocardia sp. AG03]|uniref:TetR/AcrR family transcriptional regulator n=1 Tax=Nocardia sp. AG03 TaxID=3025312 RepID=UPI0024187AB9|nr:TetR/AcrR family transcriptional regulator [Nocardia sp. AG03]
MAKETRKQMIEHAALLFRSRGYGATGIRQIATKAGAHRGVIYHHFPRGKTEVAEEVVTATDNLVGAYIEACCGAHEPVAAMRAITGGLEAVMGSGEYPPGCPVAAVTIGADPGDETLHEMTSRAFARWQHAFRDCLLRDGTPDPTATTTATLFIAAIEGALVLCRAESSTAPLSRIADAMEPLLHAVRPSSGG